MVQKICIQNYIDYLKKKIVKLINSKKVVVHCYLLKLLALINTDYYIYLFFSYIYLHPNVMFICYLVIV